MGANSKIEWTDHTFNPWQGCSKVSAGCKNCYAEVWAERFDLDVWGVNKPRKISAESTWKKPEMWNRQAFSEFGRKARVFCASLADVFEDHPDVTDARERLFSLIERTPNLIWLILTKRPDNVNLMIPDRWHGGQWPRNVWLGASVENQNVAGKRCFYLLETQAPLLFLSCEPLIGKLNLAGLQYNGVAFSAVEFGKIVPRSVDWIIVGGESGANARPMAFRWACALRDLALEKRIPFFFKQWGKYLPPSQQSLSHIIKNPNNYSEEDSDIVKKIVDGHEEPFFDLGKGRSGNLLDGRYWMEFPQRDMMFQDELKNGGLF